MPMLAITIIFSFQEVISLPDYTYVKLYDLGDLIVPIVVSIGPVAASDGAKRIQQVTCDPKLASPGKAEAQPQPRAMTPEVRLMPRPRFIPTEEQRKPVKGYAALGMHQDEIARLLEIRSPKTLRKDFRKELASGELEGDAKVVHPENGTLGQEVL